jgi:hypothetical protein
LEIDDKLLIIEENELDSLKIELIIHKSENDPLPSDDENENISL